MDIGNNNTIFANIKSMYFSKHCLHDVLKTDTWNSHASKRGYIFFLTHIIIPMYLPMLTLSKWIEGIQRQLDYGGDMCNMSKEDKLKSPFLLVELLGLCICRICVYKSKYI